MILAGLRFGMFCGGDCERRKAYFRRCHYHSEHCRHRALRRRDHRHVDRRGSSDSRHREPVVQRRGDVADGGQWPRSRQHRPTGCTRWDRRHRASCEGPERQSQEHQPHSGGYRASAQRPGIPQVAAGPDDSPGACRIDRRVQQDAGSDQRDPGSRGSDADEVAECHPGQGRLCASAGARSGHQARIR